MKTNFRAKRLVLFLIFSFFMLSGIGEATAASWYVDNAARGSNTGKSWTNAWRNFSSVVWGAAGVNAGDTLYISGGLQSKTYTGTLAVTASGASGAPITIRPGQTYGHSGVVIFNGNVNGCITLYNQSYITIDGRFGASRRFRFQNGLLNVPNALVDSSGLRHCIIRYCEFKTATIGLNSTYGQANEVDHNWFHDMRGEAALVLNASGGEGTEGPGWWDSNKVHDNIFNADAPADGSGTATDMIQGTSALSVYNNVIEYQIGPNFGWQHPDGCQISGRWVRIYNNLFRNCPNAAVSMDYGAPEDGHYYIYNNVIECTIPSWTGYMKAWDINILGTVQNCTDMLFANNTVAGINHVQTIAVHINNPATRLTNWKIEDNIFYQCGFIGGGLIIVDPGAYTAGSDVVIDYNLINAGGQGGVALDINGTLYMQPHPRSAVPLFTRYTYRGANNDYHLRGTDSAARNMGVSLAGYFNTDKDGIRRPSGSAWDIGAYEYDTRRFSNVAGSALVLSSSSLTGLAVLLPGNPLSDCPLIAQLREWVGSALPARAWVTMIWTRPYVVNRIVLDYSPVHHAGIAPVDLWFSDGTSLRLEPLPYDGSPVEYCISPRTVAGMIFLTEEGGRNSALGAARIEVYGCSP